MLEFGQEKAEGKCHGALETSWRNAKLLFTVFHRARTNGAIGETSLDGFKTHKRKCFYSLLLEIAATGI